ncbi:MAG: hypothetical protein ABR608_02855 [Pseudonocardiaceae bacterium]
MSWRPTSRTLGALFAGSAVMFSAAVLHGGTLVTAGEEGQAAAERRAEAATGSSTASAASSGLGKSAAAAVAAPGQGASWVPGATPDWGTPLADRPVHRAPVRAASQQVAGASAATPIRDGREGFVSRDDGSDQPDDSVLDNVLGYFVKGFER